MVLSQELQSELLQWSGIKAHNNREIRLCSNSEQLLDAVILGRYMMFARSLQINVLSTESWHSLPMLAVLLYLECQHSGAVLTLSLISCSRRCFCSWLSVVKIWEHIVHFLSLSSPSLRLSALPSLGSASDRVQERALQYLWLKRLSPDKNRQPAWCGTFSTRLFSCTGAVLNRSMVQ